MPLLTGPFSSSDENLYACLQEVKEAAYKGLVGAALEYSSYVWDPLGVGLQNEIKKVQNREARFVTGNYNFETGSMTGILEHLKWLLVVLRLNVPVNNFSVMSGRSHRFLGN